MDTVDRRFYYTFCCDVGLKWQLFSGLYSMHSHCMYCHIPCVMLPQFTADNVLYALIPDEACGREELGQSDPVRGTQ